MTARDQALERLRILVATKLPFDAGYDEWNLHHEVRAASAWFTNAATTLNDLFRRSDALLARWTALDERVTKNYVILRTSGFIEEARGILDAAVHRIENGHIEQLSDAVRVDNEYELLEQAEQLCVEGYTIAGAVLAGGALETHLRALCDRNSLEIAGDGSITKYNNAVGQARNAGTDVYDKTDGKNVESWGGLRNDAAHAPLAFKRSADDVKLAIKEIRQFIQRTR